MKTVLTALVLLAAAQARYIRGSAVVDGSTKAVMLAGFGMGPGKGVWKLKAKVQRTSASTPPPLYPFCLYSLRSDQRLPAFTCTELHNTSAMHSAQVPLSSGSVYSDTITAELPMQKSAWNWRFYLALGNSTNEDTIKVKYTLTLLGPGDVHLSVEEAGVDDWMLVLCFLNLAVLAYSLYKFLMSLLSIEDVEGMLVMLVFAVILEMVSLVFSVIHFSKYSEDGKGWMLFRFFSQFLNLSATLTVLLTLVFVANGYYVKTRDLPLDMRYWPLGLYSVLSIVCFALDQVSEPTALRTCEMYGVYGYLDAALKLALLSWSLHCTVSASSSGPLILQQFMQKLKVVCVLGFGSAVGGLAVGVLLPAEHRYKAFVVVSRTMVAAAIAALLRIIATEGQYHKIAGKADVLPSTKLHQ